MSQEDINGSLRNLNDIRANLDAAVKALDDLEYKPNFIDAIIKNQPIENFKKASLSQKKRVEAIINQIFDLMFLYQYELSTNQVSQLPQVKGVYYRGTVDESELLKKINVIEKIIKASNAKYPNILQVKYAASKEGAEKDIEFLNKLAKDAGNLVEAHNTNKLTNTRFNAEKERITKYYELIAHRYDYEETDSKKAYYNDSYNERMRDAKKQRFDAGLERNKKRAEAYEARQELSFNLRELSATIKGLRDFISTSFNLLVAEVKYNLSDKDVESEEVAIKKDIQNLSDAVPQKIFETKKKFNKFFSELGSNIKQPRVCPVTPVVVVDYSSDNDNSCSM